jgi:phosphoserine phosphatase
MNNIQLFDVDGTLTYHAVDYPAAQTIYPTYGYWSLLSTQLCQNKKTFRKAVTSWEKSMLTATDPEISSFNMMALTVREHLKPEVNALVLHAYARQITANFIKHGVLQDGALEYLNRCLNKNIYCVLTTGSYLDGLTGMVAELQAQKLLVRSDYLLLNGAEIDWNTRQLLHANIGQHKVKKLWQTLQEKNLTAYTITAAFGDDPYVNDKAILELAPPGKAYVIKSQKNAHGGFAEKFVACSWADILAQHLQ